jgi:hypothetical protein
MQGVPDGAGKSFCSDCADDRHTLRSRDWAAENRGGLERFDLPIVGNRSLRRLAPTALFDGMSSVDNAIPFLIGALVPL